MTYNTEEGDETEEIDVAGGDVYRLQEGTTFYVQSHPDATRKKLRIHAIFDTTDVTNPWVHYSNQYITYSRSILSEAVSCYCSLQGLSIAAYSSIGDLVRSFDEKVLQRGFGVFMFVNGLVQLDFTDFWSLI